MPFLTKADFTKHIRENVLDDITEFDDEQIDEAIEFAVDFAKGHLNSRYDVGAIFSATGAARSNMVKTHCVDIALYKIHALINPRKIPKLRKEQYQDALMWFEGMKDGTINQPDLPVPIDGSRDYVAFNSNRKRVNQIPD